MAFTELTAEQQRLALRNHILSFEQQQFAAQIDALVNEKLGNASAAAEFRKKAEGLAQAVEVVRAELAALGPAPTE